LFAPSKDSEEEFFRGARVALIIPVGFISRGEMETKSARIARCSRRSRVADLSNLAPAIFCESREVGRANFNARHARESVAA